MYFLIKSFFMHLKRRTKCHLEFSKSQQCSWSSHPSISFKAVEEWPGSCLCMRMTSLRVYQPQGIPWKHHVPELFQSIKKVNKSLPSNYRPISVLSIVLAKLLNDTFICWYCLFCLRILFFLNTNGALSSYVSQVYHLCSLSHHP